MDTYGSIISLTLHGRTVTLSRFRVHRMVQQLENKTLTIITQIMTGNCTNIQRANAAEIRLRSDHLKTVHIYL